MAWGEITYNGEVYDIRVENHRDTYHAFVIQDTGDHTATVIGSAVDLDEDEVVETVRSIVEDHQQDPEPNDETMVERIEQELSE